MGEPRKSRLKRRALELLAVDLRSLALFRVAIALVLLTDLAIRAPDLVAFHGEDGILPRADRIAVFGDGFAFSFLDLFAGRPALLAAAFAAAALSALALLIGYRTRGATFACWLFLHGLFLRNPLVATGGDILLVSLLLWGLFAPLGARASVDAARAGALRDAPAVPQRVASVATLALLGQVVMLSVFGGTAKLADPAWRAGEGVYYALTAELYTTELAHTILSLAPAGLLVALSYAVIAFEIGGPLLLLAPRKSAWFRFAFAAGFALMNFCFWLCLRVGIFSWVAIAGALLFVPGEVWGALARSRAGRAASRVKSALSRRAARIPGAAPELSLYPPKLAAALCLALLLLTLAGNLTAGVQLNVRRPEPMAKLLTAAALDQHGWPMFSPTARDHGWFVFPGRLRDGSKVDLFEDGAPVSEARPPLLSADFPSYRWRKLLFYLKRGVDRLRPLLADWLCRRWNRRHGGDRALLEVELFYFREVSLPAGETSPVRRLFLHRQRCRTGPGSEP